MIKNHLMRSAKIKLIYFQSMMTLAFATFVSVTALKSQNHLLRLLKHWLLAELYNLDLADELKAFDYKKAANNHEEDVTI